MTEQTTITPAELQLPGTCNDELRVTIWHFPDGPGTVIRFEIHYDDVGDEGESVAEVDIPIDSVMPLVLALAGSHERHANHGQEAGR